jgi:hypothetical protein
MQNKTLFPDFRYNPMQTFYGSQTPAALYARSKWLHQEETSIWKNDFQETVNALFSGYGANGSWNSSFLLTIHRLFALHLTMRQKDERIEKGIEWLLSQDVMVKNKTISYQESEKVFARDLQGLPFSGGCFDHFAKGAVLFLATIFGRANDPRVIRVYEMFGIMGEKKEGKWCNWSCSNNILRAFVVHPRYAQNRALRLYVAKLSEIQRQDGSWPEKIPLYQTVNTLAHLELAQSDTMLKRACRVVRDKQNKDGTWGRKQKEWNTFLIVHAMKRKGHLFSSEHV